MRKKNSLYIALVVFSGLFVSCWDDFTDRTYYSANVTSFAFEAQDTCPDIEDYAFNIDQTKDTGLIYNLDSLPFGRVVNNLYPTVSIQSTNGNIYMNDSLWADGDSLDFTNPVYLKNTSIDGLYTRIYKISVNVHKVDPDSMLMSLKSSTFPAAAAKNKTLCLADGNFRSYYALSGGGMSATQSADQGSTWTNRTVTGITEDVNILSLCTFGSKFYVAAKSGQQYSSTDGLTWTTSGDGTKLVTLFGEIKKKYVTETDPSHLIGLAKNASGDIYYARSADGNSWTLGTKAADDFPVYDYAVTKGTTATNVEFYTIATGVSASGNYCTKVFSTETGSDWIVACNPSTTRLSLGWQRRGASLFYYGKYLVCFGGIDSNGYYNKDLYISADNGKGWIEPEDKWAWEKMTLGIAYPGVYIERVKDTVNDKDRNFIWIFGGSRINGSSPEVWKCYQNSMIFARR